MHGTVVFVVDDEFLLGPSKIPVSVVDPSVFENDDNDDVDRVSNGENEEVERSWR